MGLLSDIIDSITGNGGRDASRDAANAQTQAIDRAIAFERESRDLARSDLQPFRQAGQDRLGPLNNILNENPYAGYNQLRGQTDSGYANSTAGLMRIANTPYQDLPGFQDASTAMSRNVMANNAARGKLNSGNTLMDLFRENAALGETFRNNAFNNALSTANFNENAFGSQFDRRFNTETFGENARNNNFNRNFNVVGMGQNAAAGQGTAALNTGISGLLTDQGSVRGAGIMGASNATNSGTSNLLNLAGMAYGMSDRRLKTGIQQIGTNQGLPVYRFRYTFAPDVEHIGYMADEVEKLYPHAVITIGGYQAVNYGAI